LILPVLQVQTTTDDVTNDLMMILDIGQWRIQRGGGGRGVRPPLLAHIFLCALAINEDGADKFSSASFDKFLDPPEILAYFLGHPVYMSKILLYVATPCIEVPIILCSPKLIVQV